MKKSLLTMGLLSLSTLSFAETSDRQFLEIAACKGQQHFSADHENADVKITAYIGIDFEALMMNSLSNGEVKDIPASVLIRTEMKQNNIKRNILQTMDLLVTESKDKKSIVLRAKQDKESKEGVILVYGKETELSDALNSPIKIKCKTINLNETLGEDKN